MPKGLGSREQQLVPQGTPLRAKLDSTTPEPEQPSLETNEPPPVPLEPKVVVVPYSGAPASATVPGKDSDCEIVEDPAVVAYTPKKEWTQKRIEQTKKTLVLHLPRCDAPPSGKGEAEAAQREVPPAPQAEGADPGAGPNPKDSGAESMDELD